MSNDYQFVNTDPEVLVTSLIAAYENITKQTVHPSSPERLFISWVADVIVQTRAQINYAANQNIPSKAWGTNLDILAELFYEKERPQAQPSTCTVRFTISAPQTSSILIPAGTRVSDASGKLYWQTTADAYVPIGETTADVQVFCMVTGVEGNGYKVGQVNKLVDVFPYFLSCENMSESDGGYDTATDSEFYNILRESEDAYSTAGPVGAYVYWAKSVSTDIKDVAAIMPTDPDTGMLMGGHVNIYALMADGTIASETIKELILAACNDDSVRPLTDFVSAKDPGVVDYNITLTYYIPVDTTNSAAGIQSAVEEAVNEFVKWQSGKLGRDINPSRLISMIMETGIKRVDLTEPVFTVLNDGKDNIAPDVARVANITITNGGYENE